MGRMIKEGSGYQFGVDPISFTTEGRYWANHNWLWQFGTYLAYKKDMSGSFLIGFKAVLFAAAVFVMMLIRPNASSNAPSSEPGQKKNSLWPWVIGGALAVLASCSFAQYRPIIVNPLFLMLTMLILFKLSWKEKAAYRNLGLLAVLFALWSNIDNNFILGVLLIGLTFIGEALQTVIARNRNDTFFAGFPSIKNLGLATIVAVIASMINPHHFHVWQLPTEWGFGLPINEMVNDFDFVNYAIGPLDDLYYNESLRGRNINGLALLLLMLFTLIVMMMSFSLMRISHMLIGLVFTYLCLRQIQMILPCSFVLAVLFAIYWNAKASQFVLQSWGHPLSRLSYLLSSVGRMLTVTLIALMIPAAWPGYLNSGRRVAWQIDQDQGMATAAKRIQAMRESGLRPADSHGISATIEFSNYISWFAPGEKIFMNQRFNLHQEELEKLLELKKVILDKKQKFDPVKISTFLKETKSDYLAFMSINPRDKDAANNLLFVDPLMPLYFGGRGLIVGTNAKLEYHPAAELFGKDVEPLPAITPVPPMPPRESWADDFMRIPKTRSFWTQEVLSLMDFKRFINGNHRSKLNVLFGGIGNNLPSPLSDDEIALTFIATREGRKGIAENQDDYLSYFNLYQVYLARQTPELFFDQPQLGNFGESKTQLINLGRRMIDRFPQPSRCSFDQANLGTQICYQLHQLYLETMQQEEALAMFGRFKEYYKVGPGQEMLLRKLAETKSDQDKIKVSEEYKKNLEQMDQEESKFERPIVDAKSKIESSKLKGGQRIMGMFQLGLLKSAIDEIEAMSGEQLTKEFGPQAVGVVLKSVDLMINAGHLERASQQFENMQKEVDRFSQEANANPQMVTGYRQQLSLIEFRLRVMEGNYRQASAALEKVFAKQIVTFPIDMKARASGEGLAKASMLGTFPMFVELNAFETIQNQLSFESQFAYQMAFLAIYDGRYDEALSRLKQCIAPQNVPCSFPWTSTAKRYLELLERNKPQS